MGNLSGSEKLCCQQGLIPQREQPVADGRDRKCAAHDADKRRVPVFIESQKGEHDGRIGHSRNHQAGAEKYAGNEGRQACPERRFPGPHQPCS